MPPETARATAEPTALTIRKPPAEALRQLEKVVLEGNLTMLSEGERVGYYARVCESLGLNPLTRPFEYITLNNKLTLYARKDATDQLRQIHGVNVERLERERDDANGLFTVTAYVNDRYGRMDSSIGVMSIKGLTGEALANALMKAETKAKRRATLSICGLGWMDEVEALDQRAIEVAPRRAVASAIRSRTAALTGGTTDPGESEAASSGGSGAKAEEVGGRSDATPKSSDTSSAGSPACAHDPKKHVVSDEGVTCGDCGEVLAEKPAEDAKPAAKARSRAPKSTKPRARKAPTEEGYHRARAHGLADERGLDPDALKRVAGDVLGYEGEWSRTQMVEADWEQVAAAVETAPLRVDDEVAWLAAANPFAGNQAIAAGLVKKLETDEEWEPVEESIAEMLGVDADDASPSEWTEYGLRIGARA